MITLPWTRCEGIAQDELASVLGVQGSLAKPAPPSNLSLQSQLRLQVGKGEKGELEMKMERKM